MARIAVIGLGLMGGGMAARLVACGHEVVGFDLDHSAVTWAERNGASAAPSIPAAVADADVVLTSLPTGAVVRDVWLGGDGIVAAAAPGTVLVELSTIDPESMRAVAAGATAAGLRPIDCPVSGGPGEARAGSLALIVGGTDDDVAAAAPVLADLGTIAHTGDVGTAKVVKLVNNMMTMGNVLVAAEAFAVGVAAGVDPQRLYDVLSTSGGRSHHFTKRFPKALAGDFDPGFTMAFGEKDLTLALELARSLRLPTPAAATAREQYAVAVAEGFADRDIVALLELYRRWAEHGAAGAAGARP